MKRLTVKGVTCRLSKRPYDDFVRVDGPGIVGGIMLPTGVTLDSPDLRERLVAALEGYRQRRRAASEMIQQRVRDHKV